MSEEHDETVDGAVRGRPGRRSAEEKRIAVLQLLAGKATLDQLAQRYGVKPQTVERWREQALGAVEDALRGGGRNPRERDLEKQVDQLRSVVTDLSIDKEILKREVDRLKVGPTKPGRSRR